MRRAVGFLLFLVSIGASVYAFHLLSSALDLNGNAFRHYKQTLQWASGWAIFAVLVTSGFLITARGRWRFVAVIPLAICLFDSWGITVCWPHASA
jgi:hypothetical protein